MSPAGLNAEQAADKLRAIQEQSARGKDALQDMFGSIIDGSMSAKEAVIQLLLQIAKIQMMKAIFSMPGMSGASSFIGGLLSFDGGGYTGNGPRTGGLDGKGGRLAMVHPRETITDHTKGQQAPGASSGQQAVHVTVGVDQKTGNLTAFVVAENIAQRMGQQTLERAKAQAPGWIDDVNKRSR